MPKQTMREGDCYHLAGLRIMDEPDAILIHATVYSPTLGRRIDHALVEVAEGALIWEPVSNELFLKDDLYAKFQVKEEARYTYIEMAAHLCRQKHWGPWKGGN